jgi:hypothetical protein
MGPSLAYTPVIRSTIDTLSANRVWKVDLTDSQVAFVIRGLAEATKLLLRYKKCLCLLGGLIR